MYGAKKKWVQNERSKKLRNAHIGVCAWTIIWVQKRVSGRTKRIIETGHTLFDRCLLGGIKKLRVLGVLVYADTITYCRWARFRVGIEVSGKQRRGKKTFRKMYIGDVKVSETRAKGIVMAIGLFLAFPSMCIIVLSN